MSDDENMDVSFEQPVYPIVLATTAQLKRLAANGNAFGFEKVMEYELWKRLKPDAHHVLTLLALLQRQQNSDTAEPVIRCKGLLRVIDAMDDRPEKLPHFDVRLRDWLALTPADPGEGFSLKPSTSHQLDFEDLTPDEFTP